MASGRRLLARAAASAVPIPVPAPVPVFSALAALAGLLYPAALAAAPFPAAGPEPAVAAPAAALPAREPAGLQTALFAGGCFWGIEAVFSHLHGVRSAVSGYHGGTLRNPTYEAVASGRTGHAETVRVRYDPRTIRYDQLLQVFFSVGANPTTRNRQGPDAGTQYRSALIPLTAEQRRVAEAYLAQLGRAGLWRDPLVTGIEPYQTFYPAEGYHQDFAADNPQHGYIRRWDAPKIAALRRLYPQFYKAAFTRG